MKTRKAKKSKNSKDVSVKKTRIVDADEDVRKTLKQFVEIGSTVKDFINAQSRQLIDVDTLKILMGFENDIAMFMNEVNSRRNSIYKRMMIELVGEWKEVAAILQMDIASGIVSIEKQVATPDYDTVSDILNS